MKKMLPYVIGGLALLVLVVVILANRGKPLRRMDERVTLRQRDKIPYGTSAAFRLLPALFPQATTFFDSRYPGSWDDVDSYKPNQAVILMADYLDADEDELERLDRFVSKGNTVFLVARSFSDDAANFFNLTFSSYYNFYAASDEDSLRLKLDRPFFAVDSIFTYPGKKYDGFIQGMEAERTTVLGRNSQGSPNFVCFRRGNGRFYIHTAPLAFSNYFVLHKQNSVYFQNVMSVIPGDVNSVLWNEYFIEKLRNPTDDKDTNWLGTLFKYPAFKWGLLTALFTLILYALLGMRRKQRIIPPHDKPKNDSLDFVKTLGRLYYDQRDHKNLAVKMGAYFLEHVRSTYKIPTHTLGEEFVRALHAKSGYPEPEIMAIVNDIEQLPGWPNISEEKLAAFHQQVELFYQNT